MAEPRITIRKSFVQANSSQVLATYESGGGVVVQLWENEKLKIQRDLSYTEYAAFREKVLPIELHDYPDPALIRKGGTNGNGNTIGRVVGETETAKVPANKANPPVEAQTPEEESLGTKVLDGLQTGLDIVGLFPILGEAADLANAAVSLARGDYVGAALSLAAAIPFAGWGATAAKVVRRSAEAVGEASAKVTKETAERKAKEATEKEIRDAAQKKSKEKADRNQNSGAQSKGNKTKEKGLCGEWLAKMDMLDLGFDEVVAVQNNSGHGVDLIGRNSKNGKVKVWEVKATGGSKAGSLSKDQKKLGGAGFTKDRLSRAIKGEGNYGKSPQARMNAAKAYKWIKMAGNSITYEKRNVFIDDIEKGCMKHPKRISNSKPWK